VIYVAYPPTLTRNFRGSTDIVPCFFTDMYIDEIQDCDILETIRNASFQILQAHKYPSIFHFMIHQIGDDMANIHFQIPACSIEQDSMNPDYSPVSYYGTIRFFQTDETVLDLLT
jgi:hypothetical protein